MSRYLTLSVDPQFRCLTGWEQAKPVPPPVAGQELEDPRRQEFHKVVPSYTSIVSTVFPQAAGERDLHALGAEVCEHLREGMGRAIEERARIGEDRFLDVHHREFIADPQGTVRRAYEWLGLELRPDVAQTIWDWQDAHATGAQGRHRYTAEQYGLSVQQIRSEYDFYIRHFDVTVED
jgi:sulfotransferase family protein